MHTYSTEFHVLSSRFQHNAASLLEASFIHTSVSSFLHKKIGDAFDFSKKRYRAE